MSIIGTKLSLESVGVQPPYMQFTIDSTTTKNITSATMVGYSMIPADILCYNQTSGDSKLTSINFTASSDITHVGSFAFFQRKAAVFVNFPNTLESVGADAFRDCLKCAIPEQPQLVTIGEYAFYGCTALSWDDLPPRLSFLGKYAFYGCSSLTISSLPDTLTSLDSGGYTFDNCDGITTMDMSNTPLTEIPVDCFAQCDNLTTVKLPASLSTIQGYVFYKCLALTTVYCYNTTPPVIVNRNAFTSCPLEHIYVPASAVTTYQSATNWSNWASIISAIPT